MLLFLIITAIIDVVVPAVIIFIIVGRFPLLQMLKESLLLLVALVSRFSDFIERLLRSNRCLNICVYDTS